MRRNEKWPREFLKLWRSLVGLEAVIAAGLYLIWPIFVSFYLNLLFRKRNSLAIEIYVVVCVGVTIAVWLTPTTLGAVLCSYFSLSSVVALLNVVFLSKALGGVESTERSLILFLFNLVQVVFMFSVWYQLKAHLSKEDALFNALLVLGTLGYPNDASAIVGMQVVTDLLLFAIFLGHLVGRVGIPDQKIRSSNRRTSST
jgi:hypothetical protein